MALDKKALAEQNRRFTLHVSLIMHQDNVTKAKAQFQAWLEGSAALDKRLGHSPIPSK